MKLILLFVLLFASFVQKDFEYNKRDTHLHKDVTGQYLLVFEYDTNSYEDIFVYPDKIIKHYNSFVTVYKKSGSYIYMMKFECIYTDALCYEDNPKKLIERANIIRSERTY